MLDEQGKQKQNTATISAIMFRYYFGLKKLWAKVDFLGVEMLAENGSGDGSRVLDEVTKPRSVEHQAWPLGEKRLKRCVQGRGGVYSA